MTAYGRFEDRSEAGRALARVLVDRALPDPVVLALPRGGVPVAAEVARVLQAPLDLVLVRKIGVEYQPELAVAAVVDGEQPEIVVNEEVRALARVPQDYIDEQAIDGLAEIERRRKVYLQGRPRAPIEGRSVIVVDDGIATGTTVRAAVRALRRKAPKAIILAVPVAPGGTIEALRLELDEIVCLEMPEPFYAIGQHYVDFHQVPDEEVVRLLATSHERGKPGEAANIPSPGKPPNASRS
jgi:putative phosphoribosyl transferase